MLQSGHHNPIWPSRWPPKYLTLNLDGLESHLIPLLMDNQGQQNHSCSWFCNLVTIIQDGRQYTQWHENPLRHRQGGLTCAIQDGRHDCRTIRTVTTQNNEQIKKCYISSGITWRLFGRGWVTPLVYTRLSFHIVYRSLLAVSTCLYYGTLWYHAPVFKTLTISIFGRIVILH